jgi:glutamine amidotransferase-like uncharacterized protein
MINKKLFTLIFIFIIIIFIPLLTYFNGASEQNGSLNKTVNVLIFNGSGVLESSVDGIEDCLNDSNNMNLTPNTHFEYTTASEINSNTLLGYDVLIIPGGYAATDYLDNNEISSESIKQFVQGGKGYLGICAGAYAASNYVDGYYSGWGIAPDVNTKSVDYEGLLTITTTSYGNKIINGSTTTIFHENGPAMYSNNSQIIMATYADNNTGYENYASIIAETQGSGRVILSGSHPELNPQNPQLLTNMILWLSKNI